MGLERVCRECSAKSLNSRAGSKQLPGMGSTNDVVWKKGMSKT